ncbi:hypothetical protein OT109_16750 [Phycisphaeraceae bacterium D3-23]
MTDRLLGVEAVPVPEGFVLPLAQSAGAASARQAPARPAPASRGDAAIPTARPSYKPTPTRPAPRSKPAPTPASASPMFSKRYPVLQGLSTQDKREKLTAIQAEFEQDEAVQQTRPTGTKLVWSDGSVDAKIMFIGEGPGEVEDREGLPFVGPAGELLNKMITAMGLSRQDVYIANVVKYRPPGNRVPTPQEAAISGPYLARQAAVVAPKAIVALGGTAAKFALQTHTGITRIRGQWHTFGFTDPGIDLMPTFHPAYLLRSYTTDNRKKVWEDLQSVLKRVG